ncbi:hypothetical protein GCM10010842_37410 [Deinococcus daejeonensis]|uniref:Uncharacterized protein n=1 Tax=Deinococcus daejeonensis TaxID=1007098 RepID=A0ABQ2JFU3_9DEIO|nr:hypothetical protein GCM10010842_37410 [Deinococcus daejeonensis]
MDRDAQPGHADIRVLQPQDTAIEYRGAALIDPRELTTGAWVVPARVSCPYTGRVRSLPFLFTLLAGTAGAINLSELDSNGTCYFDAVVVNDRRTLTDSLQLGRASQYPTLSGDFIWDATNRWIKSHRRDDSRLNDRTSSRKPIFTTLHARRPCAFFGQSNVIPTSTHHV